MDEAAPKEAGASARCGIYSTPLTAELGDTVIRLAGVPSVAAGQPDARPAGGPRGASIGSCRGPRAAPASSASRNEQLHPNRSRSEAASHRLRPAPDHRGRGPTSGDERVGIPSKFQRVTATSPLQYIKQAWRPHPVALMAYDGHNASTAAAAVGYENALPQFGREFSDCSGTSPGQDAANICTLTAARGSRTEKTAASRKRTIWLAGQSRLVAGYRCNVCLSAFPASFATIPRFRRENRCPKTELLLPAVFTHNAVLQRNMPVPLSGAGLPRERKFRVVLVRHKAQAAAGADGKFMATLPAMPAGGPFELTVRAGEQRLTVRNVLIGECGVLRPSRTWSGPSPICPIPRPSWTTPTSPPSACCECPRLVAHEPAADVNCAWKACTRDMAMMFSGVAFFFGRDIHKETGVPIGLIDASWAARSVETWTSMQALKTQPETQPIIDRYEEAMKDLPRPCAITPTLAAWEKDCYWEVPATRAKAKAGPPPTLTTRPGRR